ncbi:MAG: hypothetical protein ACKOGA_04365 [Planctomycetaceae bacterium]
MNKAFVRESDDGAPRCPRCGSPGQEVLRDTLQVHVPEPLRESLTESAWFCPFDRCEVVYFDAFQRHLLTDQVRTPVWPKDPDAPLCACFGFTSHEVEADLAEGGVSRTRACVQRAQSAEARCATASPSGQSCVAEVQRYYMQRRQAQG